MELPFELTLWGYSLNIHLILEYTAFFVAFRYYVYLRKKEVDLISSNHRLSIILGAIIGALVGSRLMGYLESPIYPLQAHDWIQLLNTKTIMGGLFGGLIGVELTKKYIGEHHSSGNLFTLPIIVGIFIGRVGCFLSGTNEFTYGIQTKFFTGMNLGDGLIRHPIALYELVFLLGLFFFLRTQLKKDLASGQVFKYFMLSYFGFRFFIEFLKPNTFFTLGLSSIQILCLICFIYYYKTILSLFIRDAR